MTARVLHERVPAGHVQPVRPHVAGDAEDARIGMGPPPDTAARLTIEGLHSAASSATLCVQSTAPPLSGSFTLEASSLMESFETAARRHFADAENLANLGRMDNAGHLIGLAAECAVKHAIRRFVPNPPRIHFPKLTGQMRKFGGRSKVSSNIRRALSPPAHGSVFDDWSMTMRYRADGHVDDAQYRKWKVAAGQIMGAANIERP